MLKIILLNYIIIKNMQNHEFVKYWMPEHNSIYIQYMLKALHTKRYPSKPGNTPLSPGVILGYHMFEYLKIPACDNHYVQSLIKRV